MRSWGTYYILYLFLPPTTCYMLPVTAQWQLLATFHLPLDTFHLLYISSDNLLPLNLSCHTLHTNLTDAYNTCYLLLATRYLIPTTCYLTPGRPSTVLRKCLNRLGLSLWRACWGGGGLKGMEGRGGGGVWADVNTNCSELTRNSLRVSLWLEYTIRIGKNLHQLLTQSKKKIRRESPCIHPIFQNICSRHDITTGLKWCA